MVIGLALFFVLNKYTKGGPGLHSGVTGWMSIFKVTTGANNLKSADLPLNNKQTNLLRRTV